MKNTNPFEEARVIARGACLALGNEPMQWILQQAVDSLKRDKKPITQDNVLYVIDCLEDVYTEQ